MRRILIALLATSCGYRLDLSVLDPEQTASGTPVLLFSDLTDGPITGWEGSASRGAAVSIWGHNLGSQRGAASVSVCGVALNADSDFAEWGATRTPTTASGQERITFWLNQEMTVGASEIRVETVHGVSRALPFTCRRTGEIVFVDASSGDDSWSGRRSVPAGTDGPKQSTAWLRANLVAGDVAYLRGGRYASHDASQVMFHYGGLFTFNKSAVPNHHNGSAGNSIAVTAYPGEEVHLFAAPPNPTPDGLRSVITMGYGGTALRYWTFSKLRMTGRHAAVSLGGWRYEQAELTHVRLVGIDATTVWSDGPGGQIFELLSRGSEVRLYGNYLHDQLADRRGQKDQQTATQLYIGGENDRLERIEIAWNELAWGAQGTALKINAKTDQVRIHGNHIHHHAQQCFVVGPGNEGGADFTDGGLMFFYNNIATHAGFANGNSWPTMRLGGTGGSSSFFNNTLFDDGGSTLVFLENRTGSFVFRNNILRNAACTSYVTKTSSAAAEGNHNLYFGCGGAPSPAWDQSTLVGTDPRFVGGTYERFQDFHLQESSRARDSGTDTVSDVVLHDFFGLDRGEGFDIGALEYISAEKSSE